MFDMEQRKSVHNITQNNSGSLKSRNYLKEYFINGKTPFFFKQQQNFLKASIYFLALLSPIVYIIVVQQKLSSQHLEDIIQEYLTSLRSHIAANAILLFLSISIKLLMVCSVIFELIFKIKFIGISWIFIAFVQYNMLISELDLALSAFMTLINWTQYFPLFIVAILLNLFRTIYLQDYAIRKNLFYTTSAYQYICFRFGVITIYLSNSLFIYYRAEQKYYFFCSCIGIVYSLWYFKKGCRLFPQIFTRNLFMLFNIILMAIFVTLGQKMILGSPLIANNQIFKFSLILLIFLVTMHIRFQTMTNQIINDKTNNHKLLDILLKQYLEMTQNIVQAHSSIIGILKTQKQFNKQLYDPFLKEHISEQNIFTQKKTAVGYFIKQGYENIIKKCEGVETQIDYCEFLCNQFNHIYLAIKLIEQISSRPLNIIQKLKLSRLKLFIQDQNTKTNQQLFNNQLKIQFVVESQGIFEKISSLILNYTESSYNIWRSIIKGVISSQIKNQIKAHFLLIEQIDQNWNKISAMMIYNQRWQLTYMYYLLFVKNQSINKSSPFLKDYDFNVASKIDPTQDIYIDEHQSEKKLLDQAIIFSTDSIYLIAKEQIGRLKIERVNKRFIDETGYNVQQIAGNQIQVLMPVQIAQIHQLKFDIWLNKGKLSNQNAYPINRTSYVTKHNQQIPAIKYYKAFYQLEKGIQFVCLLKKNIKKHKVVNDNQSQLLNVYQQKPLADLPLFRQYNRGFQNIECNIFLKSEQLKPRQTNKQISKFKLYSRMFLVLIILSMITVSWISQIDSEDISKHCNQFLTIMFMYRSPIVLSTNYMKKVTKLGNMANVNAQVQSNTKMMLSLSASSVAKSVIFDNNLNPSSIYYPSTNIPQFESVDLGNIDLFYTILSAISSLNQPVVNHTSRQFQILHSYAKPAYDNMMNITKFRLHQTIEKKINRSITKQIVFLLLHISIFVVFLVKILTIAYQYFKKINIIEYMVTDFDQKHNLKIYKYWKTLHQGFKQLFYSLNDQMQQKKEVKSGQGQQNILLPNNTRTISFYQRQNGKQKDKRRKKLQIKIFSIIIFGMLILICLWTFPQLKMLIQFYQLRQFEKAGFEFLRYFPCGPLLVRGCMEKYYYQYFSSQTKFDHQKYDDALLAAYRFGTSDYIADIVDHSSLFYSKQKQYFFGKPCQYNPALLLTLNISVQRCNSICSHSFQSGLLGYFRYLFKIGRQYLKDDKNLTSSKIDELTICTAIVTTYFFDAISTWTNQTTIKIKNLQQSNFFLTIIVITIIIIIHILVNQFRVVSMMSYQYDFVKYLYNNLVPEFTIIEEKILRQKLVIEGLIKN